MWFNSLLIVALCAGELIVRDNMRYIEIKREPAVGWKNPVQIYSMEKKGNRVKRLWHWFMDFQTEAEAIEKMRKFNYPIRCNKKWVGSTQPSLFNP